MKKKRPLRKWILGERKKAAQTLQAKLLDFEFYFSHRTVDPDVLAVVTTVAQTRHILAAVYGRPQKRKA